MRHHRVDYAGSIKKIAKDVQIMEDNQFSKQYTQVPSDVEDSTGNEAFFDNERE